MNEKDDVKSNVKQHTDRPSIDNNQDIKLESKSDVNEIRNKLIEDSSLNQCFDQVAHHTNNFYVRSYDNLLFHKDEV